MSINNQVKSFLNHLKEKWFIYVVAVIVFVFAWFVVINNLKNAVPDSQKLVVWYTQVSVADLDKDSEEYKQAEKNFEQAIGLIGLLEDGYKNYGYKKYENLIESVSKTNDDLATSFSLYSSSVDMYVMPSYCYISDKTVDSNTGTIYAENGETSNVFYCNRFLPLQDLLPVEHKDYDEYTALLNQLKSQGRIVAFTQMYHDNREPTTTDYGIKINDDYVLSISYAHSTNGETIYQMVKNLVDYITV